MIATQSANYTMPSSMKLSTQNLEDYQEFLLEMSRRQSTVDAYTFTSVSPTALARMTLDEKWVRMQQEQQLVKDKEYKRQQNKRNRIRLKYKKQADKKAEKELAEKETKVSEPFQGKKHQRLQKARKEIDARLSKFEAGLISTSVGRELMEQPEIHSESDSEPEPEPTVETPVDSPFMEYLLNPTKPKSKAEPKPEPEEEWVQVARKPKVTKKTRDLKVEQKNLTKSIHQSQTFRKAVDTTKLRKTRLCRHRRNCRYGDRCNFAHNFDELACCMFGKECRNVTIQGTRVVNTYNRRRTCQFKHPGETEQSFLKRTSEK